MMDKNPDYVPVVAAERRLRRHAARLGGIGINVLLALTIRVGPHAYGQAFEGAVRSVAQESTDEGVEFTIRTDGDAHYRQFELDNPPRLVVDFLNAENRLDFRDRPVNAHGVLRVRSGQFDDGQTASARVVFDLESKQAFRVTAGELGAIRILFPNPVPDGPVALGSPAPPETASEDYAERPRVEERLNVEMRDGQISISAAEVPLAELLAELDRVAGTESLVRAELAGYTVNVRFQGLPLGLAIREILRPLSIEYSVVGSRITVMGTSPQGVN